MINPTCSVIIPCYNGENFLAEALQSLQNQIVPATEVVVVDDGSTDSSAAIAENMGPPVRVIQMENRGVAEARNRGIRESKGEWIAFLDADDVWEPEKLKKQFEKARSGYDFVYCDAMNFGASEGLPRRRMEYTSLPEGRIFEKLLRGNFITTSGVLVRRTVLEKTRLFDGRFSPAEDWAVWLEMATMTSVGCIPQPLVRYRVHANSISRNIEKLYQGSREILAWVQTLPESRQVSPCLWWVTEAAIEGRRALGYDLIGDRRRALKSYARSVYLNPRNWYRWKSLIRLCIGM